MRQSVGQRSKLHDGSGSFQRAGSWLYDRRPAALSIVTSPPARPPATQAGHSTRYTRPHYRTVAFPPSMTNDHQSRMVVEINCLVCDHNRQLCAPSGARGPPGPSRRHQPGGRAGGRREKQSDRCPAVPCRSLPRSVSDDRNESKPCPAGPDRLAVHVRRSVRRRGRSKSIVLPVNQ